MKRLFVLLILCAAGAARAGDPPPGAKRVPVTTVVDALDDVSDFALFEVLVTGVPELRLDVCPVQVCALHYFAPGGVAELPGARCRSRTLYAVPLAATARVPGWKEFAAEAARGPAKHADRPAPDELWLALAEAVDNGEAPGAATLGLTLSTDIPADDSRNSVTVHVRITRTPGGVAFVTMPAPAPRDVPDKCGNDGPACGNTGTPERPLAAALRPWVWPAALAAVLTLATALAGVWLVWRASRATHP